MPSFSTTPPSDPRGNALQLVRTPPIGSLRAIVTSTDLVGTPTHFWHGRTVPHEEEDCKPCIDLLPWRWHAWVACYTAKTHQHVLFEMTAQLAEKFVHYRKTNGTLRGALFDACRPSKRPNGRVAVTLRPADLTDIRLPAEPNLINALSIIWNIALVDVDVAGLLRNMPRVAVNDRNAEVFNPSQVDTRGNGHAKK